MVIQIIVTSASPVIKILSKCYKQNPWSFHSNGSISSNGWIVGKMSHVNIQILSQDLYNSQTRYFNR